MISRLRGISIVLLLGLLAPVPASAQATPHLSLSALTIEGFPYIEAYLDAHDPQGKFIDNLQAEQVEVLEDGVPRSVTELKKLSPGVQFVVAIDPGPSFGKRDNKGVSRYDLVKDALRLWAGSRLGTTVDDWSLLITAGPSISHVSAPEKWLEALNSDQTDARSATPNPDTLFQAIDLAADPLPRLGMGRAVLFISPPPEAKQSQTLKDIASRAIEYEIVIHVWMVASSGVSMTQGVQALMELAEKTRGQFSIFSGEEIPPSPEEYLQPLRSIYRLGYQSGLTSSGAHQVVARVQVGGEQTLSNTQSFEIEIIPPQPVFVTPPLQIARKPPATSGSLMRGAISIQAFQPTEQTIQIVFDFPDGYKRPIVRSALYADGVLVAENTTPPFDLFTWQINQYEASGVHRLFVQVEDSLGLVGNSVETPVYISIEQPLENPWVTFTQNIPLLSVLAVVLAGAMLFLVLVLSGRLRPRPTSRSHKQYRKPDSIDQIKPIKSKPTRRSLLSWRKQLKTKPPEAASNIYAFLSPLSGVDNTPLSMSIPLTSNETTFGSDAKRVDILLDDPAIEGLHARLVRCEDNTIYLFDEGTLAGTWINYTPISKAGGKIEHGDLIHIGHVGFRFTFHHPTQVRRLVVTLDTTSPNPNKEHHP